MITEKQLRTLFPMCRDAKYWLQFLPLAEPFGINTSVRWAQFLAQAGHESQQLNKLVENLSYSVRGLMETWPKRFKDEKSALPYARNPERLANYVYADRLGNGPIESGDGWRYRGRSLLQCTGKANYEATGKALGLDLIGRPALLESPDHAVRASALYWQTNGLSELADDNTVDSFKAITKRINGGYNGWDDRLALWEKAKRILGGA